MTSKKAAELIPNLNEVDAMLILTSLDDRQVADILSKMNVDAAVKYTNLLASKAE
jgi:flagellar motility protein MotE (MotC chaperone)